MEDFEEFVVDALPRLLGLAHGLTGNPHDAWDLCQEALVRVGARWRHVDRSGNPYGYARQTLVRLNVDRTRLRHRERAVGDVVDRARVVAMPVGLDPWLSQALTTLSHRQRTAIVLRYGEDLDVAGVAAEMGCSLGTAKSHLSRGIERLRRQAPTTTDRER